jgi:hypothetical protein
LVRTQQEKSNRVINHHHVDAFNEWINKWALIEIKDPCRTFTGTNNQECPIMAALDRVLVNVEWEAKYPLAKVNNGEGEGTP